MAEQYPENSNSSPAKRWLWLLLVCVLLIAVLAGLKYVQISKAIAFAESFPERSESVTAINLEPVHWNKMYRTIGEVKAAQFVELRNEMDGVIAELGFIGGSAVEKGQLLLRLDSKEEQSQRRALLAQLELAEIQLERLTELRTKKLASKNDYDRALADKNVLLANVSALDATISKKMLTSPFDAKTTLHDLQIGQYLASNSLVTELSGAGNQYWVDFKLPQDKATLVPGDDVLVSSRSLIEEPMTASIVSAGASFNVNSRSLAYRALLIEPPVAVRPGAVVDINLSLGTVDGVFRLPASAIRRSNFGAYAYVLRAAEKGAAAPFRAERREVTAGPLDGSDIIVLSGLEPGERIAGIGAFKLQDGMLVHVVERSNRTEEQALSSPQ
ncbi:MAG: efflux RND transporter periplasmic adaptor subunit [Pseudomonadales bacterium]